MKYEDIKNILEETELPFTYYQFDEGDDIPSLPYLVFYFPSSENFGADNVVHSNIEQLNVELYTRNKDFAIEKKVENVFDENGLFWDKTESFVDSENMYEVLYIINVVIEK